MMYEELINKLRIGAKCFPGYELYGYSKEPFRLMPEHLTQAADAIEDLITALTASNEVIAKNKPKWIPVTERLPPISEEVIVFADRTMIRIWSLERYHPTIADVFWEREDGYHEEDVDVVSHWMPLPQPPKADKDGGV